jgi:hypothetical protein
MRYLLSAAVLAVLFSTLAYAAPTVFLKDGTAVTGNAVWTENNKVYLSKSKDMYEYSSEEIKQDETLKYNKLGTYQVVAPDDSPRAFGAVVSRQRRVKRGNASLAAVRPEKAGAKAVVAPVSATAAAAPTPGASAPASAPPAPKPAAALTPAPVPAAAPVAQVPAPLAAATLAAADSASPPDKDELERRKKEAATLMTEALVKNDPELMKKAIELQKSAIPQQGAATRGGSGLPIVVLLLVLAVSLLLSAASWIIFERAGQAGWKSLVPFYNCFVLMEISGKPGWWMFLLFIPIVGVVVYLLSMLSLAVKFGRSQLFGVGIFILPMIFLPLLAFGRAEYEG